MPNSDSDYDPSIDRDLKLPLVTDPSVGQQNPQLMGSNYPGMVNGNTNFNLPQNNMGTGFNNPSSGSFPNQQGVQGGMMDRFNPNLMGPTLQSSNTFSSDGLVKPVDTGLGKVLPTGSNSMSMATDTVEEGTMEMFRYDPQMMKDNKKESLADSKFIQPHRMVPMFGYTPSMSEDGLGKDFSKGKEYSREFTKKDMKMMKPVFQKKPSELVNVFKGITSSVEIREICQVDLWKKLIQKNKSLFKPLSVDSARTDSSDQNVDDKDTPRSDDVDLDKSHEKELESELQDLDTKRSELDKKAEQDKKKVVKDMEMAWALNIFSDLPDDLVIDLRLFDDDDLKDEEMVELKRWLRKVASYKTTVYPYQLINLPSRISKPSNPKDSFWSLEEDDLLADEDELGMKDNELEEDEHELELELGLNGNTDKVREEFELEKLEEELVDYELDALVGSESKVKSKKGRKDHLSREKDRDLDKDKDKEDKESKKDKEDVDHFLEDEFDEFDELSDELTGNQDNSQEMKNKYGDLKHDELGMGDKDFDKDQAKELDVENELESELQDLDKDREDKESKKDKDEEYNRNEDMNKNKYEEEGDLDLELELDLEKELELDNELDELNDLENELENELLNTNPALTISQVDQGVFGDNNNENEDKLFGELEETWEKRLNLYDYQHKWYQFRSGLKEKLRLTHFVEFEQNIKNQYNLDTQYYGPGSYGNEGLLLKLYSVGRTNLKLLLHYKHPEVVNMINSQILDLNSSNVLYSSLADDEDGTPKDDLLLNIDETESATSLGGMSRDSGGVSKDLSKDHSFKDRDKDFDKDKDKSHEKELEKGRESFKEDELILSGKESEVRRQWRKRLQTMSKETRLALVNMGKSLKYIENAFMNIESSRTYDSMVEYVEVSSLFKNCDYLNILNHSFDLHYLSQNPHDVGKEDEVLNKRELMHTRVARNLVGILPLVGKSSKVQLLRFHRMDFRTSMFNNTVNYYLNTSLGKKKKRLLEKQEDLTSSTTADSGSRSASGSTKTSGTDTDKLIGEEDVGISWEVYPVLKSIINLNYKDDDMVDGMQNHCSNYFVNSSDLALVDDTKLVLLEYVEKYPLLLNNLGMTSRIDTFINSNSGESVFSQDPQDKKGEILGTPIYNSEYELFGVNQPLKPNEVQSILENTLYRAPIFYRLPQQGSSATNTSDTLNTSSSVQQPSTDGISGTSSTTNTAGGDPTDPNQDMNTNTSTGTSSSTKLELDSMDTNTSESNTARSNTKKQNMYDFLLIRTTTSQTSNVYESGKTQNQSDSKDHNLSEKSKDHLSRDKDYDKESEKNKSKDKNKDKEREILRIRSFDNNIVLSTVGQCEPKLIVKNPKTKSYLEDNKMLLKAWVLRTAMTNPVTDLKRLRKVARKKFYPTLPEKEITAVLKQVESTSIFSMRPQALEKMIQATIKPEIVCSLESTRAQKCRLKSKGINRLKGYEGISTVSTILQQQENHFNNSISQAKEKLKELKKAYYTRLVTLNVDEEVIKEKIKYFNIPLNEYTLYGHLPQTSSKSSVDDEYFQEKSGKKGKDKGKKQFGKRSNKDNGSLSSKVDCIEKILKLTNWNITNDVKMVLKGSGQFSLYGIGDPSNSGLGLNLLKRQIYSSVNTNVGTNIYNISIIGNSNEDLRKLSMEELSKRLQLYGVSDAIIRTLPRWDQVALVRQYRDGFGTTKNLDDTGNKFRIPPQEYQKQLVQIIQKQKQSLTGGYTSGPNSLNNLNSFSDLMSKDDSDDTLNTSSAAQQPSTDGISGTYSTTNTVGGDPTDHNQDMNPNANPSTGTSSSTKLELDSMDTNTSESNTARTNMRRFEKDKDEYDAEKEMEELKLLKESFNLKKNLDLVIEDDKLIPIPGLMWLRQSRKTATEPFGNERAAFIYGEENIAKVLKWRRECIEKYKKYIPNENAFGATGGKRMCRNCGQQGHIASNPKCPLYSGDKKHDSSYMKQQLAKKGDVEPETSDDEMITKSTALMKDTQSYIKKNLSKFKTSDSDTEVSDTVTYPTSVTGLSKTSDGEFKRPGPGAPKKRKVGAGHAHAHGHGHGPGVGVGTAAAPAQGTEGATSVGAETKTEAANKNDGPISNSDVKIIGKILNTIIKENRYRPFVSRIPETIAPNYYKIIKHPMWLSLLKLRMKTKYYLNISDFVKDLLLLEINCKIYNSEHSQNAWLRQMSQVLVDDLISRITHHIQNKNHSVVMRQAHASHITNYRNLLAKNKGFVPEVQMPGTYFQQTSSSSDLQFSSVDGMNTDSIVQNQQHQHQNQYHVKFQDSVDFQTMDSSQFSQTTVVDSIKSEQTESQEFSTLGTPEGDNLLQFESNPDLHDDSMEDNTQSVSFEQYGDQDNLEDALDQFDNNDNKEDENYDGSDVLDYGNGDNYDGSDVLYYENDEYNENQEGSNVGLDLDDDSNVGKDLNPNMDMDEGANQE